MEDQLSAGDPIPELTGQYQAVDAVLVIRGRIELVESAPFLCALEGDVGVSHQLVWFRVAGG